MMHVTDGGGQVGKDSINEATASYLGDSVPNHLGSTAFPPE